jgi:hypothetical protein
VKRFFRWVNSTLIGHIAYYGSLFAVTESVTSIYLNFTQHTLTLIWAIFTVIGCAVIGVMCAVIIWFVITLPRIRRGSKP